MRSWRSAILALVVSACGEDRRAATCATPRVTYETFGAPFVLDWCRGCHSAQLIPSMRQDAPLSVNFDTLAELRAQAERIRELAGTTARMPPRGGPSPEERELLVEWIDCGMP